MISKEYAFVIPAYNPDVSLLKVVDSIQEIGNNKIFIINDGSDDESNAIFKKLKDIHIYKNVIVLEHVINLGKGAALKMAFNHILVNYVNIAGVVTVDSDGQHSTRDCFKVMEALKQDNDAFILGYRIFSSDIPFKSYVGNHISKMIYNIILGKSFKDTQTGLRGLTKGFMKECLNIKSNRFEFETEQLAISVNNLSIIEIPIETIYIEDNKASSFRPLVDSFRIYFILFRYGLSSIVTAIIDFLVFMTALSLGSNILIANLFARTVSIGIQFKLLDTFVFHAQSKMVNFIFFSMYVYVMGTISSVVQIYGIENLGLSVISAKILVEGILFFINFAFLRLYIFRKKSVNKMS
ncbi:MAG: Unknown protein [uncultured Sulfurovum sp.]|uniref:Uncharacterized protein n=1 Tax=uncultured Sulfurovum sp. TaxID=269237 RepID=A0A6S6ST74_9BACT|nr:MAG: Unknown protein [uncultured Sulfurovum sp.]